MKCLCGCGLDTPIAARSDSKKGWIKGSPMRFVYGHGPRYYARASAFARFVGAVSRDPNTGCWLWGSFLDDGGYGRFNVDNGTAIAHRWGYEQMVGPIPDGYHIDHLCRVHNCVNPDHLEAVEPAENTRRGKRGILSHLVAQCRRGHEYTPDNTIFHRNGRRQCRACRNAALRARRATKRAAGVAA